MSDTELTRLRRVEARLAERGIDPLTILAVLAALAKLLQGCFPAGDTPRPERLRPGPLNRLRLHLALRRHGLDAQEAWRVGGVLEEMAAEATGEDLAGLIGECQRQPAAVYLDGPAHRYHGPARVTAPVGRDAYRTWADVAGGAVAAEFVWLLHWDGVEAQLADPPETAFASGTLDAGVEVLRLRVASQTPEEAAEKCKWQGGSYPIAIDADGQVPCLVVRIDLDELARPENWRAE